MYLAYECINIFYNECIYGNTVNIINVFIVLEEHFHPLIYV